MQFEIDGNLEPLPTGEMRERKCLDPDCGADLEPRYGYDAWGGYDGAEDLKVEHECKDCGKKIMPKWYWLRKLKFWKS